MHLRLKSAVDQFRFMSGEGRASVLISKAGELLKLQKMRTNTVLAMLYNAVRGRLKDYDSFRF